MVQSRLVSTLRRKSAQLSSDRIFFTDSQLVIGRFEVSLSEGCYQIELLTVELHSVAEYDTGTLEVVSFWLPRL